jgi:hypothetical protein
MRWRHMREGQPEMAFRLGISRSTLYRKFAELGSILRIGVNRASVCVSLIPIVRPLNRNSQYALT